MAVPQVFDKSLDGLQVSVVVQDDVPSRLRGFGADPLSSRCHVERGDPVARARQGTNPIQQTPNLRSRAKAIRSRLNSKSLQRRNAEGDILQSL